MRNHCLGGGRSVGFFFATSINLQEVLKLSQVFPLSLVRVLKVENIFRIELLIKIAKSEMLLITLSEQNRQNIA